MAQDKDTILGNELLGDVGNFIGGLWDDITGKTQSDAAIEAAQIQADAALEAAGMTQESVREQIAAQQAALATQREDLQPFTQFGSSFIDPAQQAAMNAQQLFSDPTSIMSNPMFQAIQEDTRRQNVQNAAVRGRLGTGGTAAGLEQSALRTGFDILNSERSAQLQNAGFLANLVGMGQSAAAGQGAAALQTGQGIASSLGQGNLTVADLLTGAAAAQAGGVMGAANAQAAGTGNVIGLGTTIASSLYGVPTVGTNL